MLKVANIKAEITSARIVDVFDVWKKKPQGLGLGDTDAIVVAMKLPDGTTVKETFYVCIKADGTFDPKSISRRSLAQRSRFRRFLEKYIIGEKGGILHYNIAAEIGSWKGREVDCCPFGGGYMIDLW